MTAKKKKVEKNQIKNGLLVTVSGGRSSAMMARHIQTSPKYAHFEKLYVFCNTSQERPETIEFLKNIVEHWKIPLVMVEGVYSLTPGIGIKSKIVDFDTLDMTGKVFSEMIAHKNKITLVGNPCKPVPYCSESMKTEVSHHYAKTIFGTTKYIKAVGYRREDIPKRVTMAELRSDKKRIAPLLTDFQPGIGKMQLGEYFRSQPFQLGIDSKFGNCELCWKKSDANLIEAIQKGTRFIEWHDLHEKQYGNMFFRENKSIWDLVKMAEAATKSGTQAVLTLDDEEEDGCVCSF